MKTLLTGLMLVWAAPVAWAQQPTAFESVVECNLPAGKYNLFRSESVEQILIEQRREIHGELVLQALNRHEKFGSTLGFVTRSSSGSTRAEFQLSQCGRAAGSPICGVAGVLEHRQIEGSGHIGGRYALNDVVPFSLQMTAERQLTVKHGGNTAVLDMPFDVVSLQVKCVGVVGKVTFDLAGDPIG